MGPEAHVQGEVAKDAVETGGATRVDSEVYCPSFEMPWERTKTSSSTADVP
jgi:hypothetical protein